MTALYIYFYMSIFDLFNPFNFQRTKFEEIAKGDRTRKGKKKNSNGKQDAQEMDESAESVQAWVGLWTWDELKGRKWDIFVICYSFLVMLMLFAIRDKLLWWWNYRFSERLLHDNCKILDYRIDKLLSGKPTHINALFNHAHHSNSCMDIEIGPNRLIISV